MKLQVLSKHLIGGLLVGVGMLFVLLAVSFIWVTSEIQATDYPAKPINIIVPWPAGTLTSLVPRTISEELSKRWGVPTMVVNKPGGSGVVGTLEAVKAAPDGYTILGDCPGSSSIMDAMMEKLPFNIEERTYICRVIFSPLVIAVNSSSPWKTLEDLAEGIRKNPGDVRWSMSGGTAASDIILAQLRNALLSKGVDLSKTKTVTFQGTAPTATALAGGHVEIACGGYNTFSPFVSAGKVRIIAVVSSDRQKGYADIPTTFEQGFSSVNYNYWVGFSAPPNLAKGIQQTWIDAIKEILVNPEVNVKFERLRTVASFIGGDDFRKFVINDRNLVKALIKR